MAYYSDFPIITNESKLPLHVISVGMNEWQYHVIRQEGYGNHQIIYCTRGSGTLIVSGKVHQINPNMRFFLPSDCPHEYYSNGDIWDTHWICFSGFAANEMLELFKLDRPRVFSLYETKNLERLIRGMHEAINFDRFYGTYRASGLLYPFMIEINRLINLQKNSRGAINPTLVHAVDYINIHFCRSITLEELSSELGVSKQYICRLFKDNMGVSPVEYIMKRRIHTAKELLVSTDRKIEDIAYELGFCSSSYFEKIFKRHEGISPAKFRKM